MRYSGECGSIRYIRFSGGCGSIRYIRFNGCYLIRYIRWSNGWLQLDLTDISDTAMNVAQSDISDKLVDVA